MLPADSAVCAAESVVCATSLNSITLKLTLTPKHLDKTLDKALLTPFLKAYNKREGTTLDLAAVSEVHIDDISIPRGGWFARAGSTLSKDSTHKVALVAAPVVDVSDDAPGSSSIGFVSRLAHDDESIAKNTKDLAEAPRNWQKTLGALWSVIMLPNASFLPKNEVLTPLTARLLLSLTEDKSDGSPPSMSKQQMIELLSDEPQLRGACRTLTEQAPPQGLERWSLVRRALNGQRSRVPAASRRAPCSRIIR